MSRDTEGSRRACTALAHSNIALAKYWGKADRELNLPAVPSLSLTLAALSTTTSVEFLPGLTADELSLNGRSGDAAATRRLAPVLDRVRQMAGLGWHARVVSSNDFPTASGLASSAAGFAALAVASAGAAGLRCSPTELSELSRLASVSAARSILAASSRWRRRLVSPSPSQRPREPRVSG